MSGITLYIMASINCGYKNVFTGIIENNNNALSINRGLNSNTTYLEKISKDYVENSNMNAYREKIWAYYCNKGN